ncbi:MAG: hypothetical protein QW703_01550 [Candidatus Aenigmatarchaeota archaeon]
MPIYAVYDANEGLLSVDQILKTKRVLKEFLIEKFNKEPEEIYVVNAAAILFKYPQSLDGEFSSELSLFGCKFEEITEREFDKIKKYNVNSFNI